MDGADKICENVPAGMRCCVTCREVKPQTDYYFKDGTRTTRKESCKVCVRIRVKKFYTEHPERFAKNTPEGVIRARSKWKEEYWKNPEKYRKYALKSFYKRHSSALSKSRQSYQKNRKNRIAYTVKWREENKDRVKKWLVDNRQKMRDAQKRYKEKNPKSHLISRYNRKVRKQKVGGRLSPNLDLKLLAFQRGVCPYCKINLNVKDYHMDHVIALSRGGRHCDENMQLTCKSCNLRKHAKDPILFGREMGIFIPSTQLAI